MKLHSASFIFPLIFFLPLISCQDERNLDEFRFLIGKWEGEKGGTTFQESWKKENNHVLAGEGIAFSGSDTFFHEKLKLEIQNSTICYVANVQSNKGPVSFKLVSSEKNIWRFENKEHDFPQEITYHFVQPDSLHATIGGNDKGKSSKEEFHFKKAN